MVDRVRSTCLKEINKRFLCFLPLVAWVEHGALHNAALEAVLGGGSDCERMLGDLLETDSLAARITCEFTEVLVRYDCGQPYSIIHHCEDCR
ncbi:hypothetical protein pipiens_017805, partial [Culex pipiens pipiens]